MKQEYINLIAMSKLMSYVLTGVRVMISVDMFRTVSVKLTSNGFFPLLHYFRMVFSCYFNRDCVRLLTFDPALI